MPFRRSVPQDHSTWEDPTQKSFRESCRDGDFARVQELFPRCVSTGGSLTVGLGYAGMNGHIEIMQYLLDNNVIINKFVVEEARSPAAFELLFKHGLDIHETDLLGNVPLMFVVKHKDEALLHWFLDQGADPNFGPHPASVNSSKNGPGIPNSGAVLEAAIMYSTPAIVDILLERGAILENSLAFHAAVQKVVQDNPDWEYEENTGERDVSRAIEMMEHLLHRGANINKFGRHILQSHWGGTALHAAGVIGDVTSTRWMLDHGADPTITDVNGWEPHFLADLYDREEVRVLLFDASRKRETQ